jgi:hypothetical protein
MVEYKVARSGGDKNKDDELPRWIYREIRDHDRRYDCNGLWGGLVWRKCGR